MYIYPFVCAIQCMHIECFTSKSHDIRWMDIFWGPNSSSFLLSKFPVAPLYRIAGNFQKVKFSKNAEFKGF